MLLYQKFWRSTLSIINYEYKATILKEYGDLIKLQKLISHAEYADYMLHSYGIVIDTKIDYETAIQLRSFFSTQMPKEWQEAERINHASYKRVKRLKSRIACMLEADKCLFLTLTFTDDVLSKTSQQTRRRYVARFLSQFDVPYVANIDFGSKNGREHYHAIIQCDNIDYGLYHYGAINGQKIRSTNDNVKLAKYITKLTNHAIKETTKRCCIIYSKDKSANTNIFDCLTPIDDELPF